MCRRPYYIPEVPFYTLLLQGTGQGQGQGGRVADVIVVLCNQDEVQYNVLRPKYELLCRVLASSALRAPAGGGVGEVMDEL